LIGFLAFQVQKFEQISSTIDWWAKFTRLQRY